MPYIRKEPITELRLKKDSSSLIVDDSEFKDQEVHSKTKKTFTIKKDIQNIDPQTADIFALYVKSLDRNAHINPLVKRITYKDGKTRIGVIYEFVQLYNEFVPLYPMLLAQLKKGS